MTQATSGTGQVVLVVADRGDLPADAIIIELDRLGVPVVRLDPAQTPLHMDCTLRGPRWHGQIQTGDGRAVDLETIGAVCWRWHSSPPGHPGIAEPGQRAWAAAEDAHALRGVLRSLPQPMLWMNHPESLAVCESSKPVQLVHAVEAGLPVPDTLVTTSGAATARWASDRWGSAPWTGQVVYKAFDACHWQDTTRMLVPARTVTAPPPASLHAAAQFQARITGEPVRAIMVGEYLFAAALTDHAAGTDGLDWRPRQNTDLLDWRPVDLPDATVAGLRALMRRWQITYGAFDLMAPSGGGDPVFLECNPSGQWGAVETATGMPISAAIASTLAAAATPGDRQTAGTGAQCPS